MATNSERTVNVKLADCLRGKLPQWSIQAEQTNVFVEKMMQPDIVISHEGGLTVILETEFSPATAVESDAQRRLGKQMKRTGEEVEQCIAVKLPESLREVQQENLESSVRNAQYFFTVFTHGGDAELLSYTDRWPESGWVEGEINDLANCVETVALSETRVAKGVQTLELGVSQAAGYLHFHGPKYILSELAKELHQEEGEQTTRMAMAILANAIIFHMRLVRLYPEIHSIQQCKTEFGTVIKQNLLQCWQTILDINYWPIFQLACDIYKILPERDAQKIIQILDQMAAELERFGAADIQDLSGRMFQKLITDRKFLATFYTLPASATLLAELAVSRLNLDWRDPNKITKLKIADLACGTGALLGAAYHALSSRYRRTGGDDAMLHAKMMESVLTAADIMPSAVHLTASTLSGMHPDQTYQNTQIINMPYGENGNENGTSIGSLDLMQKDQTRSVFGSGRKALTGRGVVVDDYQGAIVEVPHGSMDIVIMNPPFTRPTNHEATGVPVPSFAGFSTKGDEQKKMADRLKEIRRTLSDPAGHGNAGLASNFIDLAHIKLRPGGTLALVLPATFMQGKSWENARALLRKHYEDILVTGIATYGETERAFSADTSMAELLLVATKKKETEDEQSDIFVVNVTHRPRTQLEATVTAQMIERSRHDQNQDVGKILLTNTQQVGNFFRTKDWTGFAVKEDSLLILMHTLSQGNLLLPRMASSVSIPVCKLGELGVRGLLHRDINGRNSNGTPRGPFDLEALLHIQVKVYTQSGESLHCVGGCF